MLQVLGGYCSVRKSGGGLTCGRMGRRNRIAPSLLVVEPTTRDAPVLDVNELVGTEVGMGIIIVVEYFDHYL